MSYDPSEEHKKKKIRKKDSYDSMQSEMVQEQSLENTTEVNEDKCWCCRGKGTLIPCDSCTRSYHTSCVSLKKPPAGTWDCPSCLYTLSSHCPSCEKECAPKKTHEREKRISTETELLFDHAVASCSKCNVQMHVKCVLDGGLPLECLLDSPVNKKYFNGVELQQIVSQLLLNPKDAFVQDQCKIKLVENLNEKKTLFYLCFKCLESFGVRQILNHIRQSDEDEDKSETFYLTLIEQSSFMHCHYIMSKTINSVNARKLRNYKEKYESEIDDDGLLNSQDEELGEYLEIERVVGCKRVGVWKKLSWIEVMAAFDKQESSQSYGSRDNLKVFVKWARLFYQQCTWEDSYFLQKYRKEMRQYFHVKILEETIGTKKFEVEKQDYLQDQPIEHPDSKVVQPVWLRGGSLHPFQLEGLDWLRQSWVKKNNVILADEMGLGKTIQTISFLNSLNYEKRIDGPFLIVAPATTLYNWLKEFKIWADYLNVIVYTGTQESRDMIRDIEFYYKNTSPRQCKFNALITSYDTAINDSAVLKKVNWEVLVVDEAHRLKNADSKFFKVSSQLETKHKILLTGTPLQNNILELINLIEFIAPTKAKQVKNLESLKALLNTGADSSHQVLISEEDKKRSLFELTRLLQPHILRRTKSDVKLQVPEMEEIIVKLCLTDTQKFLYKNVLLKNYENLRILDQRNKNVGRANLLNILMSLRLVCNHPYLFLYKRKFEVLEDGLQELINQSNKLKFLDRIIPRLLEMKHKMLIFSQFTMMLDLVQELVERRGWACERLDGSTGIMERQKIIDSFNRNDAKTSLFLLSTRAGGLGINLTSADTIIFTDSDFNPYRDLQAISRAHRMGQSKTVKVFRLVSKYTAEERIIEIATKKLLLEEIIINPINKLKKEDFSNIFKNSTWELFNKNLEEKDQEFTDEQLHVLLQRNTAQEAVNPQLNIVKNDLNDYYLSGFKFTSCNFERTVDDPRDVPHDFEQKDKYWETLLDSEARLINEKQYFEMGKGKRVKKQYLPNYQDDAVNYNNNPSEYSPSNNQQQSESDDNAEQGGEPVLNFRREAKPPSERMQKLLEKDQAIIKFFQSTVLGNCEMNLLNGLTIEENTDIVVYGFSVLHRIEFLEFVLHFGMEFEGVDSFLTALMNSKPLTFKNDMKPQYEEFKKYLKEFYAILLDADNFVDKDNIVFCGLNPIDVLQRVCGLSCIKRKYLYYLKRPEKYIVKNENYIRIKATKVDGQIVHHNSAWTNYDDFLLSKGIVEKGYSNWNNMFEDNSMWNYPSEGEPVWYRLYRKFNEESLEELRSNNLIASAQQYLAEMMAIKAQILLTLIVDTEDII